VFAWAFLMEGALGALSGSIVPYLPFQAATSLAGATVPGGATPLPFAAAVTIGAAFLLAAAAARITPPRDITSGPRQVTGQLAGIFLAAAHGRGRHIPLIILGVLVVIAGAAFYYAWHRRH
jgi:hypothetical protein